VFVLVCPQGNVVSVLPVKLFEDLPSPDGSEDDEASQMLAEDLDGQSDGEDESRDDSENRKLLMRKLRTMRGGVSALFGIGQGPMVHGHVDLHPVINIGQLFEHAQSTQDGLPEQGIEKMDTDTSPKENFWQSISEPVVNTKSSFEQFLKIAEIHLKFDENDLHYVRELHRLIDEGGTAGVQRSSLVSNQLLSGLQSSLGLDDHLQTMLNFNTVMICDSMIVIYRYSL